MEILDAVFAERSLEEWETELAGQEVIWSPVRRLHETSQDPQVLAMGYFSRVDHPELGPFATVGPPRLRAAPSMPADRPAPALGGDAESVLRAAGLGESEIEEALSGAPEDGPGKERT